MKNLFSTVTRGRWQKIDVIGSGVILAGGTIWLAGISPWVLLIGVIGLMVRYFSRLMEKSAALSSAVILFAVFVVVVIRVSPFSQLGLSWLLLISLLGTGAFLVVLESRSRFLSENAASRRNRISPLGVLFVTTAGLTLFTAATGARFLGWATNNDAVWTLVQSRILLSENGIGPSSNGNPAPLTSGLIAVAISPGREYVSPENLLAHDVSLMAQLWLIVVGATSLLFGKLVDEVLEFAKPSARYISVVGSGLLLFTWFYAGYATQFGFYNASISLLLLISIWAAWNSRKSSAGIQALFLSLASIATLATWAPLVVIPGLLIVAQLVKRRKDLFSNISNVAQAILGYASLAIYMLTVTLADLSKTGSALAADGAMVALLPVHVLAIAGSTLFVVLIVFVLDNTNRSRLVLGFFVLLGASFIGFSYLVIQRINEPSIWGYYPAKFSWIATQLMLLVGLHAIAALIVQQKTYLRQVFTVAGAFLYVVVLTLLPGTPPVNFVAMPISNMVLDEQNGRNAIVAEVSELAAKGSKNMAFGYSKNPSSDLALNNWLLQLGSVKSSDEIRWYSYFIDGTDAGLACEAIQEWGDGVIVHSRNEESVRPLTETCSQEVFEVEFYE